MKKWGINRIRESFSAQLRIYVVGFTALLFILAFYVFFRFSYGFIRDEAMHRAEALLDNTILRIDRVLDAVETAAGNSAWEVEAHLDEPDSLYAVISRFVERNPVVCGSAVAFREGVYGEGREDFSPYVYDNPAGGMEQRDLGNDTYNYQEKEWFAEPLRTG